MNGSMEDEHYLFISSTACDEVYASNEPYDFTISLEHPLTLRGTWKCALLNLTFTPRHTTPTSIVINCDFVRHSYINGRFLPVLDIAYEHRTDKNYTLQIVEFTNPLYHYLNRTIISSFRIKLRYGNTLLEECSHLIGSLTCLLHLRRERHDYVR